MNLSLKKGSVARFWTYQVAAASETASAIASIPALDAQTQEWFFLN